MQYKVLAGKEFFTLTRNYIGGETVELPEHEGAPFVGKVLDAPVAVEVAGAETPEQAADRLNAEAAARARAMLDAQATEKTKSSKKAK